MLESYHLKKSSRLGELLLTNHYIDKNQLNKALAYQKTNKLKLGESLIALGLIEPKLLEKYLSRQFFLRCLIAGSIVFISPLSTVKADNYQIKYQLDNSNKPDDINTSVINYKPINIENQHLTSDFVFEIEKDLYKNSRIKIGLSKSDMDKFNDSSQIYVPQISIFTSNKANYLKNSYLSPSNKNIRHDRYKNTLPVIYDLTLKGYSLFEQTNNKTKVFELNHVQQFPKQSFELMFSITKNF